MSDIQQEMTNEKAKPSVVSIWLRGIGKLRDGLLIFGGATYVLGYLVSSINARRENLGLLPALEPQYLAAGVTPMLLIWLSFYGFKHARKLPQMVANWRDRQTGIWPKALRALGIACLLGSYGLIWLPAVLGKLQHLSSSLRILRIMVEGALMIVGLGLFLYPTTRELSEKLSKWFASFIMFSVLAIYLSLFVTTYLFVLYPILPQEFGGVRPRCAYIDVAKDQVSEATLKEILPSDGTQPKSTVAQSVRMRVYFSGTEFMLIRPDLQTSKENQPKRKLFELRKDVIKAVNWCE